MMKKKEALIIGLSVILFSFSCSRKSDSIADESAEVPNYLKEYSDVYLKDPLQANLQWFKEAKFGLFMHYGLYSLLEQGEWIQLKHDPPIPVADYDTLFNVFTAKKFDPDFITDLALKAGMKYINLTSKHHDGFSLFNTKENDFNSLKAPLCGRDLVGELAEACDRKGLGLFLYYSYAADWRHPYFYSRESGWSNARPAYENSQPEYLFENDEDFRKYVDFVHAQLKELLGQYKNIAGIWFDPIMGYYNRPDLFPIDETYALVRSLNPHVLISFKQGANGTEDFAAPERSGGAIVGEKFEVARNVYALNMNKPKEICNTLQPHAWGYNKSVNGQHKSSDEVIEMLKDANKEGFNLLLNVGPLPDGSFPEEDIKILRETGEKLQKDPIW